MNAGVPEPTRVPNARLSLNQRTMPSLSIPELLDRCAAAGIGSVGLWREPVAEHGLARTAKLVRDAGVRVSTLCRGGFVTAIDRAERAAAIDDNRRAIEEAATLGSAELAMVVGGLPPGSRDLGGARERLAAAIAVLAPEAAASGVRLGLEPLHPMFCADRSVLCTLDEALDVAAPHPASAVGVVVDTYHVWWDPAVLPAIGRAAGRIAAFQVSDWVLPLPADVLHGRGLMGDGSIDLRRLRAATDDAGYVGDIEVEIFNETLWAADPGELLAAIVSRFAEHVAG